MFKRDHATEARTVGQVALVPRAGALDHHQLVHRHATERGLGAPVVEHLGEFDLRDDALVSVAEVVEELVRRGFAARGREDRSSVHGGASRRLAEVDGLYGALAGARAAERAGLEVDGAHHAPIVELGEDGLAARLGGLDVAHALAGPAVDAGVGDDVGQCADAHLEVAGVTADRLHGGTAVDGQVRVVDGHVAVEALACPGLCVGRRQALAAVVGGEDGADAGGAAAQERAPLDELDVVAHLRELGGRLRAGHAAADDDHGVATLGVAHRVRGRVRVGDGRVDDAGRLVGHRRDVVAVDPAAALADVGDLEAKTARQELLEAARGEVRRAAGEDELALILALASGVHELEHPRLPDPAAPVRAAQHVGVQARVLLEPVEVDVAQRAGALAEEHGRTAVTRARRVTRAPRAPRRPRLDGPRRAAAGAGATAQALLVVVEDGAVHGDPLRHLHRAVGLVAHELSQGRRRARRGGCRRARPAAGARRRRHCARTRRSGSSSRRCRSPRRAPRGARSRNRRRSCSATSRRARGSRISRPRRVSGIRRPPSRRPPGRAPRPRAGPRIRPCAAVAAARRSRGPSHARRPRTWAAPRRSS